MDAAPPTPLAAPTSAWQPITFGGVAAFAGATLGRLLLVATLVALAVATSTLRSLYTAWDPVIDAAVARLPPAAAIEGGRLIWPANTADTLAANSFLAVAVNPAGNVLANQVADVQMEFGRTQFVVASLLGYVALPYPSSWVLSLRRAEVEPLWGAWSPYLLAGVGLLIIPALLAIWAAAAAVLALPMRAYAFLLDRDVNLKGCWRLCVAALLPGAVLMALALWLYGLRRLTLPEFLLVYTTHPVVDFLYLVMAPFRLPRFPSPFAAPPAPEPEGEPAPPPDESVAQ